MKVLALFLFGAALIALGYVRFAPNDPATWNIDPTDPEIKPGGARYLLRSDGDAPAPLFEQNAGALLEAFEDVVLAHSMTERLAGDPLRRRMTFLSRSAVLGVPNFTTVEALDTPEGCALVVFARSRFGIGIPGVNKARVDGWLTALRARLEQSGAASG